MAILPSTETMRDKNSAASQLAAPLLSDRQSQQAQVFEKPSTSAVEFSDNKHGERIAGVSFNLLNAALGTGILLMPFEFAQLGLFYGTATLVSRCGVHSDLGRIFGFFKKRKLYKYHYSTAHFERTKLTFSKPGVSNFFVFL